MILFGISANEHDASLAVADGHEIVFASAAERYSRRKNDRDLNQALIDEALRYGTPDAVVWYEKPFLKRTRKLAAGQYRAALRRDGAAYLRRFGLRQPVRYVGHHESHAAGGFFTSPFDQAAILVVDAIGEWDTISLWEGTGHRLRKLWSQRYPDSLGLLYSAFTSRIGLKPNEEEYILMGMSAFGSPVHADAVRSDFIARFEPPRLVLRENVHRGIRWWHPEWGDTADIAASVQAVTEEVVTGLAAWAAGVTGQRNLVLAGGVALNCVANTRIAESGSFDEVWIMPNPGDGGSSLGAAAAYLREHLTWPGPYLGHDIRRRLDVPGAVTSLAGGEVIGVANGRAEFGPRALGNRSILADPRRPDTKERVDQIKRREPFRPFAPAVLAEHADRYFHMPVRRSPYMQFVAPVRDPGAFPAITHQDGTARVQTVTRDDNPGLYSILEGFWRETGCPLLLNTSLNVKGEPLVNSWADAARFSAASGVRVF
jgi:carbamoyltransferase